MEPVVSITVVTCNKSDLARLCISSIIQYTDVPFDLKIVDNGSTDYLQTLLTQKAMGDQGEMLETLMLEEAAKEMNPNFCGLEVVRFPENRFICAATNEGFKDRKGQYYCFIPSDTIMTENYMSKLLASRETHQLSGISPRWFERKNLPGGQSPDIVDPLGWATDWGTQFRRGQVLPTPEANNEKKPDLEPNWMVGIMYLITKELWTTVGEWDTQFLLTVMDNDYAWRSMILGFKLGIVNDVWIFHAGPITRMDEKQNPGYHQTGDADWQRFIQKWGTDPDDTKFLYKLMAEKTIRVKVPEDGPNEGIPEEIKNRRIT